MVTRRAFLRGTLVTGASLVVPLAVISCARDRDTGEYAITDWISILSSGQVVLGVSQPELGQGSYTALPQILADELDADWKSVVVRFVSGKEAYRISFHGAALRDVGFPLVQTEGASMSTTRLYHRLRVAGAQARDVLIRAACIRWGHAEADCSTHLGYVVDTKSGMRLSYGELAKSAAKLAIDPYPPLKTPAQLRLIGESLPRLDTPAKCDGSAIFGIDVTVPDMLNAAIRIAPTFTGTLVRVRNEEVITKMPGVHRVVKLPNAVAVVADKFWQAKRGADALDAEFDPGPGADLSTAKSDGLLRQALDADTAVMVMNQGDARSILAQRAKAVRAKAIIERRFVVPHIAHAPMEPVNATVHVRDDAVEVWGPIQSVDACETEVATALGRPTGQVRVHVTYLGGSFGRKFLPDFVVQAALVAKEVGRPVKLLRTREEDLQHDLYRANAACRIRAVVDERGYPLAVHARVCGQSLFAAVSPSWLTRTPDGAWDESMVEGLYNQEYRVPNLFVEAIDTPLPVPLFFMRSAGSTAAVFFWESFISDLAHRARLDPYHYRRELLAHDPAALKVLDAVAAVAEWERPAAPNVARGIAYHCYVGRGGAFRTHVAEVAEVERTPKGFVIRKITCAVDAGLVINPNLVKAQIEGGIGFALTNTLKSRITFSNGRVDQANFPDYPLLSLAEMPQIVSVLVDSNRPPQGVGEVVLAPVAPAVAGAILQASGQRIDVMPFPERAVLALRQSPGVMELWLMIRHSVSAWIDDYAPSMGAALAYYTMFSIAPLLVIVIAVAGIMFGNDAAQGHVLAELRGIMGEEGALAVEDLLKSASDPEKSTLAAFVGIITLLVGATTVFSELQSALDRIWRAEAPATSEGLWRWLQTRMLSLGMILGFGFLLLVSLVMSAALAALGLWWGPLFGAWELILQTMNFVVSFVIITLVFAMIYKSLPRVSLDWRDVWIGATVTALLFTIGKLLIGLYLGRTSTASAFGAAGSLVVLLVWVYYSAQIFLLGAEFTWVYAHRHGSQVGQASRRRPQPGAG